MGEGNGAGKSSEAEGQPPGSPAPVFISYASQDAAVANAVVENLEQHGIICWIAPRDVTPGSQYADEIVGAINDTKVFVLVLSEHAVASPHVGRELERAASKRRRIIVLRTDAAPLTRSFEYFLSESQWIDVAALGVPAALMKLTQAVGQRLSPSSWVSPGLGADVRDPADRNRKPSYLTIKRVVATAVFLVVAAVVVGVMVRYWPSKQGGPQAPVVAAISDKSIAVLPFVDMSEKKDQEYFGDGMAEEIIDLLVKIPGLKVIGRTSSFTFKGQSEDLRGIGRKLGVAYVLEGSVRKSGDRLRVTAQLIDSRNGTHLLSQTYDRDLSDVLKMQDEIAIKVVRALQVEVSSTYTVSRPALRNKEAYALYLRGAHAADRYELQGWEQARSDFQRALELDPSFAEAAEMLAAVYNYGGSVGFMPPAVAFEQSRHFAELALKLDPQLAWAYGTLGDDHNTYDWDWAAADRELKEALVLAPNDPGVLQTAAVHSLTMGRSDEALKQINAAVDLNPLEPGNYFWLSLVQLRRARLADAEAAIRRAVEISPTFTFGQYTLGFVLLARNQPQAALEAFLKEPDDGARIAGSVLAYFALGRKADSDKALAQTIKGFANRPSGIAAVYAFRGESEDAFRWLDRAYAEKDSLLFRIKYAPEFDSLHGDPRYNAFLKKMNLPE